jgi:membrane glycosyltransferase
MTDTSPTTPAGLQSMRVVNRRRWLVLALNIVTYAALLAASATVLDAGGWSLVDGLFLACIAVAGPWTVLGFWNATIGLWLLHGARNPMGSVAPFAAAGDLATPLTLRVAVLMTIRNEDPARAFDRLRMVKASLDRTGEGAAFDYFVLSDTADDRIGAAEEAEIARWRADNPDAGRLHYRRRTDNTGYKAGNLRDFVARWGAGYDLMLPLDADSLMSGDCILRLTRMMQAHPRLGILQSLVVGMPAPSAFARIFQFGMRHGMRPYTMGQAWWVGECGPFWGHNAMVRIAPFATHCDLPLLSGKPPLGGHILSHDQVEATLMRRAGYEVRVLPREGGSWEENPPTLMEFLRRDARWCQGNLQYLRLLDTPGLFAVSRFQLVWAILMFIGVPAVTLAIALLPFAAQDAARIPDYPTGLATGLYLLFLAMFMMPRLAGMLDVALSRGGLARYGGALRFAASVPVELLFSFLLGSVITFSTSVFILGLAFGKSVIWSGQARDSHGLSWRAAASVLWPQTLFGLAVGGALLAISPSVLLWSLPLTAGYVLAIPFAVATAAPAFGRALARLGLCAIPEDIDPPEEIRELRRA